MRNNIRVYIPFFVKVFYISVTCSQCGASTTLDLSTFTDSVLGNLKH